MMGRGTLVCLAVVGDGADALGWRPQQTQHPSQNTSEAAVDILKARYVRGAMSTAEYNVMRDQLTC